METQRNLMLLAAGGSLALLLGAYAFQALGYAPCQMCLWQRWPHGAAIALGAVVLVLGPLLLLGVAGALAASVTAVIGLYHTGVERGFWEGPASCSGGGTGLQGLSGADLLSTDAPTGVVMCDEVAWADPLIGLSMASWNAVLSLALMALWIVALRAPKS
ncbi:MAG: disulfide bond formation protein B [Pseudomonadota bacterium]